MTRMGPEALLVSAKMSPTARRGEVAEYARIEYSLMEAPRIAAGLLDDFEAMPSRSDSTRRLFRRAWKLFRRDEAGRGAGSAGALPRPAPLLSGGGLVALPGVREAPRKGNAVSSLATLPTMGRA